MDQWGTRWARENGHIKQEMAPGHSRKRCCYVDFLNTGPAVAATLRRKVSEISAVRRISNIAVTEVLVRDGRAHGVVALDVLTGECVAFYAKSIILAAGGLTKLFSRNSASANMGGDAYALALRAGADLIDMEFVQFFPIGHLAPRLVGMDPIMWDPFRYKLGGKLLNGRFEEFVDRYGGEDFGKYTATRDLAAYSILKEVEAGRGTPHGGAYLDFRHIPESRLRAAFGPVIDRLLANGIDLAKTVVEVGPIAHYHMGGIRVDANLETRVEGLYAAGEAVGGANGANRLSGNAITEAFVFGERAGRQAAGASKSRPLHRVPELAADAAQRHPTAHSRRREPGRAPVAVQCELQELMWKNAGPFRTGAKLGAALERIQDINDEMPYLSIPDALPFNLDLQDALELRAMLLVAEAVVSSALARTESRGAHQREDFPDADSALLKNQTVELRGGGLARHWVEPVRQAEAPCDG
jgi:succinate dehydrogenase/fumarate reductase flavoprotein subunit